MSRLGDKGCHGRSRLRPAKPFFREFGQLASQANDEGSTMLQGCRLFTHTEAGRTVYLDACPSCDSESAGGYYNGLFRISSG